jgi:aryl-alcohol dehydrogenase-like predicted oxidoreductase
MSADSPVGLLPAAGGKTAGACETTHHSRPGALAWVLRGGRVTSALVGASSTQQSEDNVAAIANLDFDTDEPARMEAVIKR